MKSQVYDLTKGNILSRLLTVALPVMGTQFMQMAYNLTDMFWLGKLGSGEVAASGTAGMYMWLGMSFMMLGRMGGEIGVSQNLGRGDKKSAYSFAHTSIVMALILGIAYGAVMAFFRAPLVSFFNIQEAAVVADTESYLLLVAFATPFSYVTAAITGCFSGSGNTRLPFYINALGLVVNMILDPLLIFSAGMGIEGAGVATTIAQAIVCTFMIAAMKAEKGRPFERFKFIALPEWSLLKQIFKWGVPIMLESMMFTFLTMLISRIIASYGQSAMAVARIGSQIESLSWLISGGYSSALTAFVGQNYGAGKWTRIHKGFRLSIAAMLVWGAMITALLFIFPKYLFMAFLPDAEIIEMGATYLRILSTCQLIACLEFTTAGCFRGMGRTLPPSIASIVSNAFRVVLVYFCSEAFGLIGIWWAITIGGIIRGAWLFLWYYVIQRGLPREDIPIPEA